MSEADRAYLGYKLTLGIGVTAGVLQILLGLFKAGRLVDLFPLTPVHGMLAGIGVIIVARQLDEVVGVAPTKGAGPLALLAELPGKLAGLNPEIACIGAVGLAILFGLPLLAARARWLKRVPAQLVVLVVAVALGSAAVFDLEHEHTYLFPAHLVDGHLEDDEYAVGPKFLVTVPNVLANPAESHRGSPADRRAAAAAAVSPHPVARRGSSPRRSRHRAWAAV